MKSLSLLIFTFVLLAGAPANSQNVSQIRLEKINEKTSFISCLLDDELSNADEFIEVEYGAIIPGFQTSAENAVIDYSNCASPEKIYSFYPEGPRSLIIAQDLVSQKLKRLSRCVVEQDAHVAKAIRYANRKLKRIPPKIDNLSADLIATGRACDQKFFPLVEASASLQWRFVDRLERELRNA